jgi:phosphoribosyl-AMP cyclohydrolase
MNKLEEGKTLKLDFGKIGKVADNSRNVVPVAIQNINTGDVILIAYTNKKAFKKAIRTRNLVLWSTSRNKLWEKGKTSGETFDLVEAYVNCEQNSLLYKVRPSRGGICHTKNNKGKPRNCYYRRINLKTQKLENLDP